MMRAESILIFWAALAGLMEAKSIRNLEGGYFDEDLERAHFPVRDSELWGHLMGPQLRALIDENLASQMLKKPSYKDYEYLQPSQMKRQEEDEDDHFGIFKKYNKARVLMGKREGLNTNPPPFF